MSWNETCNGKDDISDTNVVESWLALCYSRDILLVDGGIVFASESNSSDDERGIQTNSVLLVNLKSMDKIYECDIQEKPGPCCPQENLARLPSSEMADKVMEARFGKSSFFLFEIIPRTTAIC
jgi:hypothetical protein